MCAVARGVADDLADRLIKRAAARFDDQDRLLVYVDGEPSYLARLDANDAPTFALEHTERGSPPGLALTSSGEPFVVEPHRRLVFGRLGSYETSAGGLVQRLDAAGAALWTVDKPHSGVPSTDPWWTRSRWPTSPAASAPAPCSEPTAGWTAAAAGSRSFRRHDLVPGAG